VAPNLQLAVEIAVRALDRNSVIAIIMEIGNLDRAQADAIASALDGYIRTGVSVAHFDQGARTTVVPSPAGKPAMSGALRAALAAMGRPVAEDAAPPPELSADAQNHGTTSGATALLAHDFKDAAE
jgi:hypothetical protein